jgi:ATP-dependent Lon protease
MGGASLYIEVQSVRHKSSGGGTLTTTGQMGSVMEESTRIAHTFARRKLEEYQVRCWERGGWGLID